MILPPGLQDFWKKVAGSSIGSRIAKGAFWSLTGSVVSQGLMLLSSIVIARILGKTEFGELGMIRSTVNMFTVFASFGLGLTATKYIAEYREKDKVKTGKIIGLTTLFAGATGSFIAVAVLVAAPFLAEKSINAPHLIQEIRLGAFMLFFSALNGAQTGVIAGFESFKTIAKINLVSGVIAFVLQIGLTLLWGLSGAVVGFGFNFLVLWVLNFAAVRKESKKFDVKIFFKSSWSEWAVLYRFSLPALFGGILTSVALWSCSAMLVNQPNGYEEMAIFTAANQWRNIILFIPTVLSQITLPLLSSSSGNQRQFKRILKINVWINMIVSLVLASGISLASGFILKTYGDGFAEGKIVLVVLTFTTVLISINSVIGQAIAGKGQMWYGFVLNLLWSMILLSSTYFFLGFGYGAKGLAYGYLVAYAFHTCFQALFIKLYLSRNNK